MREKNVDMCSFTTEKDRSPAVHYSKRYVAYLQVHYTE